MERTCVVVVLLGCAVVGACGDDARQNDTSTGAASTGAQSGGAGGGGMTTTTMPAGGNGGTGGSGVGGSGGSLPVELMDLWPLGPGKSWTFEVVDVGNGGVCPTGQQTLQVLSTQLLDGYDAYNLTSWCESGGGPYPFAWDRDGNLLSYDLDTWELSFANDVNDGAIFYTPGAWQWTQEDAITVPAGTFDNCWTAARIEGTPQAWTFCAGVGPVRSAIADQNGDGADAQLTSHQ